MLDNVDVIVGNKHGKIGNGTKIETDGFPERSNGM